MLGTLNSPQQSSRLSSRRAAMVTFVSGCMVMMVEMVGARLLTPTLGTSYAVWSILISCIFLFMALGASYGGRRADRDASLGGLAMILTQAGGAILLLLVLHYMYSKSVANDSIPLIIKALSATILLFSLPSFVFGMIYPYAVRLSVVSEESSGELVGKLSAWNTFGSILGTFCGGFLLTSFLGCREILLCAAGVLFGVSLMINRTTRWLVAVRLIGVGVCLVGGILSYWKRSYFYIESSYQTIMIEDIKEDDYVFRCLRTEPGRTQSGVFLDNPAMPVLPYTTYVALLPLLNPQGATFLMLGGGAYTIPAWLGATYPDISCDIVELDPAITKAAKDFFAYKQAPNQRIFHEDARCFLNRNQQLYDFIFLDVYNSYGAVPFHMLTEEAMAHVARSISSKGLVMINLVASVSGTRCGFYHSLLRMLTGHFADVKVFATIDPTKQEIEQNFIFIASKRPFSEQLQTLLSDDDVETYVGLSMDEFKKHYMEAKWSKGYPRITDDFAPVERFLMF